MAKNTKPEKERHWYSLYQNLDPEQLRRQNVASFSVIPTREKLPAPPPSTPNYSGRPPTVMATGELCRGNRCCAVLNGYRSPSRSVALTSTIQAAAAATHNAAAGYRDGPAGQADAGAEDRGAMAGRSTRAELTGRACLQPSSFGSDSGHEPQARKRKSLPVANLSKRARAMDIKSRTPQLFRTVLGAVAAPQEAGDDSVSGGDADNDEPEASRTLAIPLPHRDLAASALQFVPRQRDRGGAAAELEMACYPSYHVAHRDEAVSCAFPDAKRVHLAMLDASEELRLRSLAVVFAEVSDKSAFDGMNDRDRVNRRIVPFPRWLFKQGLEGTCKVPRPMRKNDGEVVRVLRSFIKQDHRSSLRAIMN